MGRQDKQLHALIEPAVTVLGYELVGVEFLPSRNRSLLRVYIDSTQGVSLNDCARASHQISGVLDVADPIAGEYALEVSSPGLNRPLFTPEHFERFAGSRVRVRLSAPHDGRRNFSGELQGVREGTVLVQEEGIERSLPIDKIAKARLVPDA